VDRTESDYYTFRHFDADNARQVLSYYTQFFQNGPVLELACGPGVFLSLLSENDVQARGVDLDPGMVDQARAAGHEVVLDDALAHLKKLPDSSLGGLFAAHFIEHLVAEVAQDLYIEAQRVLRDGGVFVAVVPNAGCLSVLGYDFWRDPTHVRFYDPVALEFFARQAGFEVEAADGNPQNHPGPPPLLRVAAGEPLHPVSGSLAELIRGADQPPLSGRKARKARQAQEARDQLVHPIAHLIGTLDDRIQRLQHELFAMRSAYTNLLEHLYPPNETFVVARKPSSGVSTSNAEVERTEDES
jgi:SAM-dependent methyltransferase